MKTLDVMTKTDLMKPSAEGGYSLTAHYIKTHWREMGGYGKPLLFDRDLVELHLREKFLKDRLDREANGQNVTDLRQFINDKIQEVQRRAQHVSRVENIKGKSGLSRFGIVAV